MDLILIRLTPPTNTAAAATNPQVIADILWATATPTDHLEHIRARQGPARGTVDLALFHRSRPGTTSTEQALTVCHRAIRGSPALAGWQVRLLGPAALENLADSTEPAEPRKDLSCHPET